MLVLSRKAGEVIYITDQESGATVTLTVLATQNKGKVVRLGLDDPTKRFRFLRKEVHERIEKETELMQKSFLEEED